MSRRPMRLAMLLWTMLLPSCETQTIPAPDAHDFPFVSCTALTVIHYHAPLNTDLAKVWSTGSMGDPSNAYDTPSTVEAVRKNNAAIEAVCPHA